MAQVFENVACTVCSCVCDDLRVTVERERIIQAEGACGLATPWFLGQGIQRPPTAVLDGKEDTLEAALGRVACILRTARSPLIYGLSHSSTAAQRAAIALADDLGATIDIAVSLGKRQTLLALQQMGESTCSLGEVRHRADLVIFWRSNPIQTHPRHLERYSALATGRFIPRGRADRTMVAVDIQPTPTTAEADLFITIKPGYDFETLWILRSLVRGLPIESTANTYASLDLLRDLADRMRCCRYGVIFYGPEIGTIDLGHRYVEALLQLVADLNDHTRFYAVGMGASEAVAGAHHVLSWQTGYPLSVSLARGYPRYSPGEFSALDMLRRQEVDACLLVGSKAVKDFSGPALDYLRRIPTIVLHPATERPISPATVSFTTSVFGVHHADTAYRMDDIPIPLQKLLPNHYPTDAEILQAITRALQKQDNPSH